MVLYVYRLILNNSEVINCLSVEHPLESHCLTYARTWSYLAWTQLECDERKDV